MPKAIVFMLCLLLPACAPSPQLTTTTVDYVRSSDLAVPDQENILNAAAAGDPDAQFRLGLMHYRGTGVAKSHKEAMRHWQTAANAGHPGAQYSLGMAYFMGEGVINDFAKGCYWLGKAAGQGVVAAAKEYHARCDR